MIDIPRADVTRYITPLREGGSMPAIVEASNNSHYVLKFKGSGQGAKSLIAELLGIELARLIGLKVPKSIFLDLDESFSRLEPDEEIQDLLRFSIGLNFGVEYLSGSLPFDLNLTKIDSLKASKIVLLDSILINIDRTHKNTNLLVWNNEVWVIDFGASMYFHHSWHIWTQYLEKPFPKINEHVLLSRATKLDEASQIIKNKISEENIFQLVHLIPEDWMNDLSTDFNSEKRKEFYITYLTNRIQLIYQIVDEIKDAQKNNI